jgi:hypothetical protein
MPLRELGAWSYSFYGIEPIVGLSSISYNKCSRAYSRKKKVNLIWTGECLCGFTWEKKSSGNRRYGEVFILVSLLPQESFTTTMFIILSMTLSGPGGGTDVATKKQPLHTYA